MTGCQRIKEREQSHKRFYLTLQAATAGVGIPTVPRAMVCDDLHTGSEEPRRRTPAADTLARLRLTRRLSIGA